MELLQLESQSSDNSSASGTPAGRNAQEETKDFPALPQSARDVYNAIPEETIRRTIIDEEMWQAQKNVD